MAACKTEPLGAAALLRKNSRQILRLPLAPSEKNNAASVAHKPRTREVTSRYKSGITGPPPSTPAASQRCPTPNAGRMGLSPTPSLPKRSQSAERSRPTTPTLRTSAPSSHSKTPTRSSPTSRPPTPVHDVTADMKFSSRRLGGGRIPDGLWPGMRSLSASFQSESISDGLNKRGKPVSNSNVTPDHKVRSSANLTTDMKRTPSRGKNASDQSQNSKPVENSHARSSVNLTTERKRSPLRGKGASDHSQNSKPVENSRVRVLDQHWQPGIMNGKFSSRAMSRSMDLTDRASRAGTFPASPRGVSPTRRAQISDVASRGLQKTTSEVTRRMSLDRSGRLERELGMITSVSVDLSERNPTLAPLSRTSSLPLPGSPDPSTPSKASSTSASSSRGTASPSRTRPSTPSSSGAAGRTGISSSVLGYILDVQKGKKSANHIEDAHQLRLLHNMYSQWRFVNARADAAMSIQKSTAENILHSVWNAASRMHDSAIMKRINLLQSRQEMKVDLIVKDQVTYLEDWALLEREHSSSLLLAIEALTASTLQLPIIGGARADIHAVKDAISSAVDVMQAMGSSICHLLSMVEGTNSVVSELAGVAAQERAMIAECRELLASTAAVQVQESSVRTHLLQMRRDLIRPEQLISTMRM